MASQMPAPPALLELVKEHKASIMAIACARDGSQWASANIGGLVLCRSLEGTSPLRVLGPVHAGVGVHSLAYSPDGAKLAVGDGLGTISIYSTATRERLSQWRDGHHAAVVALAWAPDAGGTHVLSGSRGGPLCCWDTATNALENAPIVVPGGACVLAFSPDGSQFVVGGGQGRLTLWNAKTGTRVQCEGHTECILSVAYAPDGKELASVAQDNTLRCWDTSSGRCLNQSTPPFAPTAVAYSPSGKDLLIGDARGMLQRWKTFAAEPGLAASALFCPAVSIGHGCLPCHAGVVNAIAYAPDGDFVFTGSQDGSIGVWLGESQAVSRARPVDVDF